QAEWSKELLQDLEHPALLDQLVHRLVLGVLRRIVRDDDRSPLRLRRARAGQACGRVDEVEPVAGAKDDRAGAELARAQRLDQVTGCAAAVPVHDLEIPAIDEDAVALGDVDGVLRLCRRGWYRDGKRHERRDGDGHGCWSSDHGSLRIAGSSRPYDRGRSMGGWLMPRLSQHRTNAR